jgi:hypothetical protein
MSRRAIQRMLNSTQPWKERRSYTIQVVDATITAGGSVKPGDKASISLMNKKTDDFENYETQVWKPVAEKNILSGNLRQWVLAKLINKTDNAYDGWTHFVFDHAK